MHENMLNENLLATYSLLSFIRESYGEDSKKTLLSGQDSDLSPVLVGEMVNDHQTEIVKKLSEGGYILDGTNSIIDAWRQLDTFTPRPCDFECTLPQEIGKLIDKWIV